jgi:hypothetical protein
MTHGAVLALIVLAMLTALCCFGVLVLSLGQIANEAYEEAIKTSERSFYRYEGGFKHRKTAGSKCPTCGSAKPEVVGIVDPPGYHTWDYCSDPWYRVGSGNAFIGDGKGNWVPLGNVTDVKLTFPGGRQ